MAVGRFLYRQRRDANAGVELVLVCLVDAGLLIEGAGEPGRILADTHTHTCGMGVVWMGGIK